MGTATNAKDFVKCVMERVLRKAAQLEFSFAGRRGKLPFKDTQICSVVLGNY